MFLASVRHFNPSAVGIATAAGGFATVLMQTPAGAITDETRRKRLLVAVAALVGAAGAIVLAHATAFWLIVSVQIIVGAAFACLPCAVGALSLGLVGRDAPPKRQGMNQAFNSSGNIAYALTAGMLGKVLSLSITSAREATSDQNTDGEEKLRLLVADPRVVTFTAVVLLFHLANASMLVLFGQLLPKGSAAGPSLDLSAGIVGAQILMVGVALIASRYADRLGRKPIFAFGIGVLIARGAFSNVAAGFLATAFGFSATLVTLAGVAGCAFMVFVVRMPETCAAAGRATPASAAA